MKKVILMFLILAFANAALAEIHPKIGNAAAGKFYKVSSEPMGQFADEYPSPWSTGTKLTDEDICTKKFIPGYLVGWSQKPDTTPKPVTVVVDLGSCRTVMSARLHTISYLSAHIEYPTEVSVQVMAEPNQAWVDFGTQKVSPGNTSEDFSAYWVEIKAPTANARFLKFHIKTTDWYCAIDELEVIGSITDSMKYVPENGCYHGAYSSVHGLKPEMRPKGRSSGMGIELFEQTVGKKTSMVLWYQGMAPGRDFEEIQKLREEHTGKDFDGCRFFMFGWLPKVNVKTIAGGAFDEHFKKYFTDSISPRSLKCGPVWFRPMNEFNGSWAEWGLDPKNFIRAWRRMYNIAEQIGATGHHVFVWSPNSRSYPNAVWNAFELYYPGDQYVDWVGMSCYPTTKAVKDDSERYPIETIKPVYVKYNYKPMMIAEGGFHSSIDRVRWVKEWFQMKEMYPMIKAFIWENHNERIIQLDEKALELYRKNVQDPYWLDTIN